MAVVVVVVAVVGKLLEGIERRKSRQGRRDGKKLWHLVLQAEPVVGFFGNDAREGLAGSDEGMVEPSVSAGRRILPWSVVVVVGVGVGVVGITIFVDGLGHFLVTVFVPPPRCACKGIVVAIAATDDVAVVVATGKGIVVTVAVMPQAVVVVVVIVVATGKGIVVVIFVMVSVVITRRLDHWFVVRLEQHLLLFVLVVTVEFPSNDIREDLLLLLAVLGVLVYLVATAYAVHNSADRQVHRANSIRQHHG